MVDFKNLTIFQQRILNIYIVPILIISSIVSLYLTYNITKYFSYEENRYKSVKVIKHIKRKNIEINGKKFNHWVTLSKRQKDIVMNDKTLDLENDERFKIIYRTKKEDVILNRENVDEYYNLLIFLKVFLTSVPLIIFFLSIPLVSLFLFYKKYYLTKLKHFEKFINLPFFLQELTTDINKFQDDKNTKIKKMDRFLKFDVENKYYVFETHRINQYDIYKKYKDDIQKYLDFETIEIKKLENGLKIRIYESNISKFVKFDKNKMKKEKISVGKIEKDEDLYLDIKTLNHTILIGESGSGKSVFVQNLLTSFFYNEDMFEKFIFIDPKRVELSRYEKLNKVQYVERNEDFIQVVEDLQREMYKRLDEMKEQDLVKSKSKFILFLVDEFRTLKNNTLSKEDNEKLEKMLIDLIQKSRRTNIRMIFRGQKRDTQNIRSNVLRNIQTRILLKTKSNDNIRKILGNSEELEEMNLTLNDVKKWNKGRGIYFDGESGEKYYFQSPFFDIEDEEQKSFMFSFLSDKKVIVSNETEIQINKIDNLDTKEKVAVLNKDDLEQKRVDLWEKSNDIQDENIKKSFRSKLFKIKMFINKDNLESRNELLSELD